MHRIFSDRDDDFIIKHYMEWGVKKCAEHLGFTRQQIGSRMGYLRQTGKTNIKVSTEVVLSMLRKPKPPRPELVNADQFIQPSTPEVAYLLGLLWADGCVYIRHHKTHRLIINMLADDLSSVEPCFDTTGTWHKYLTPKKEGRLQRTFVTSNKRLTFFLQKRGYCSKNGYPYILDIIPTHLRHYWFRGLMDGDGCFYIAHHRNQASVCGPANQEWKYLTDKMKELDIKHTVVVHKDKTGQRSAVCLAHLKHINKWGDYIYQGFEKDGIGLPRKREKFLAIKHRYQNSVWHKTNP